ncbi:amino acid ABC transporter, ATP-binding protein [Lactobacillus plantarum subsp. plantarum ST-III] [Lactiplantibacillus mudanjiangensis]|uniref:methionine ABC transporter ATP-binding protein n=1 Tax=Lactiplantibacillus mudanjiangensis TaxID=1296538 RepID=UPI0010140669|nr:ATP-binding cassette domain-containing protein [Lactiplantibacillus mudanjiangensis]VDG33861.1 amino acid ABC transporter, ATP-binding protein [Lactobacillus plantarum subsp. plantarum ST-III] [Lactiplantibacillus mudanjiangensis]
MSEHIIELADISVTFNDGQQKVNAVQDVNLQIDTGDIYGIIGYSGAGKSTLVRVINLLQLPTTGRVTVNGQQLQTLAPAALRQARKQVGMIFQHFNLMQSRTVLGNVIYPLLGQKISKRDRQAKALALLKLVGLADYADTYPNKLSGGQKQRVAIARALVTDPQVLISDEATSALDPKTTAAILALLQRLNRELGVTIVLITHEMQVIKSICHHVAVMENGRIVERGPVAQVFTAPKAPITLDFVETSTNVRAAIQRITRTIKLSELAANQELIAFKFIGQATKKGVISQLSQEFKVDVNILFANIDQIDGQNVGDMIAIITGDITGFNAAVARMADQGVHTRLIDEQVVKGLSD